MIFTVPNSGSTTEGGWIQKAIKHPGALHADLGVPQGKKIPLHLITQAAKAKGTLGRRARLALTLRGITMRRMRKNRKEREG